MKQATVLRDAFQAVPTGVSVTEQAEDLSVIHRRDCAAAVWTRPSLPSFQSWIDALDTEKLPRARIILRPAHSLDIVVEQRLTFHKEGKVAVRHMIAEHTGFERAAGLFDEVGPDAVTRPA